MVRERLLEGEDPYGVDTNIDLPADEITGYRSCAMTVAYGAQDRTDLQRTMRELANGAVSAKAAPYADAYEVCDVLEVRTGVGADLQVPA